MSNIYYIILVCVCSFRHPACNTHAPYIHPCPFSIKEEESIKEEDEEEARYNKYILVLI